MIRRPSSKPLSPGRFASSGQLNEIGNDARGVYPGVTFGYGDDQSLAVTFPGKVVEKGPGDEADFDDNRYWIKPQFVVGKTDAKFPGQMSPAKLFTTDTIVRAVNCYEAGQVDSTDDTIIGPGSHLLPEGQPVIVRPTYDGEGNFFYALFETIAARRIVFRAEAELGIGKYAGHLIKPPSNLATDTSLNLTIDDVGKINEAQTAVAYNINERNRPETDSAWIDVASNEIDFLAAFINRDKNGNYIVFINGNSAGACPPPTA